MAAWPKVELSTLITPGSSPAVEREARRFALDPQDRKEAQPVGWDGGDRQNLIQREATHPTGYPTANTEAELTQFTDLRQKGAPMTTRAHTATRWEAPGTDGDAWVICRRDENGKRRTIAHVYDEQVKNLMVNAWAIPQLVEALADARAWLLSGINNSMSPFVRSNMTATIERIEAALRAVEEGTP